MSFIFLSFCGAASHAGSQLRSAVERAAHNGSARRGKEESARLNVYFKSVELVYLAVNADRLRFVELKHGVAAAHIFAERVSRFSVGQRSVLIVFDHGNFSRVTFFTFIIFTLPSDSSAIGSASKPPPQ